MLNKLNEILKIIEERHINFYFNHSKEELENFKKEALAKFKLEDNYDVLYVSNYLIKRMMNENDSHTIVRYNDEISDILGLVFRIINNKVYIYKCIDEINNYLYDEVLEINGIDINIIVNEISDICCYQTDGFREARVAKFMNNKNYLRSLPSIDNVVKDIVLKVNHKGEEKKFVVPVLSLGSKPLVNYEYNIFNDSMQIIYSLCKEFKPNEMLDFVERIKQVEGINYYIVDLRGNTGGSNKIIDPLVDYLKDKKVIVLIDKYVFSAGKWACLKLKKIGATFIGTDIGTPVNCFGNDPWVEYDKFTVQASEHYYPACDIVGPITSREAFEKFMKQDNAKEIMKPRYFHPDIYVEESIEDLREGRDVYLEKALEYIDRNNSDFDNIKNEIN